MELSSVATNLFALKLPILEKILRPILVYVFLVVMLRIFGKRELAQLNPFDLVVLLSLSNTVQNAIIGEDNSLIGGLIGAASLLGVNYLVVRYLFQHRRLDQIFEGTPTKLIHGGRVSRKALARELLSESDLLAVAHRQGFNSFGEIEECTLEPGGVFFIKGKTPGPDEVRRDILKRLDELRNDIAELKQKA